MTIACLVLAAGRSTRLGRPKQLLPFRGRPLLEAALATVRACAVDQRLVALGGAVDDVRDAVSRVRSDLPTDLRDPIVSKVELSGSPILTYTVASSRMDDEALSWFVDDQVTRSLLSVRGVGAVSRVGGVTREVRVELDPARLQALNATAAEISRQLRQTQREASGGRTDLGGAEQSVRTIATVQSAAELAALEITLTDGRRVRLDQVASVSDTVGEKRSTALLDGKQVVGFEIVRTKGAGETEVAAGVRAQLEVLKKQHPEISVVEAFNFVDPVQENYNGSMALLFEGAALAVLVVWLFLRDWRATLVATTALPLSIIPTFWLMSLLGFSLNGVTLLSLSLVVGILVDDAIVEIENIMRHLRMRRDDPPLAARTPSGGGASEASTWGPTGFKTPYAAAMEAADVVIMNDDLRRIPETIRLSRKTHAVLWQNISLALGIKAVFLVLALFGSATMWMAVFADLGATLLVVANGLRMLRR